MPALPRRAAAFFLVSTVCGAVVSCGSRSGLFDNEATLGASVWLDGGPDASRDARRDGRVDSQEDEFDSGDQEDALPPIDVAEKPDVVIDRTDCKDPNQLLVYVVTENNDLFSFNPADLSFTRIGSLVCPSTSTPFSMAVDRKGVAYVLYADGNLFKVSTKTAACTDTTFQVGQQGFVTFGMGFASDTGGASEKLYVAQNSQSASDPRVSGGLGAIDTTTLTLTFIGDFQPELPWTELTGTGDGRLFGYGPRQTSLGGGLVSEIDKSTAAVVSQSVVSAGNNDDAFAFAFWGGDFWIFNGRFQTTISRFRPSDGTTQTMTTFGGIIVGAGVSTCAPQQ